jgi:hypothetical protein
VTCTSTQDTREITENTKLCRRYTNATREYETKRTCVKLMDWNNSKKLSAVGRRPLVGALSPLVDAWIQTTTDPPIGGQDSPYCEFISNQTIICARETDRSESFRNFIRTTQVNRLLRREQVNHSKSQNIRLKGTRGELCPFQRLKATQNHNFSSRYRTH